ncbi:MAG: hypothetical protein HQL26_00695 [Candidatus Omnitrophica bacterium]|nr:hypothetical protein [Candidatus Omnitrophota bacterium]
MSHINRSELLKNKEVLGEINRYKDIESGKAGYDIGLEKASREWFDRYAEIWVVRWSNKRVNYHLKSKNYKLSGELVIIKRRLSPPKNWCIREIIKISEIQY